MMTRDPEKQLRMDELNVKITRNGMVDKWAFVFIEKLKKNLRKLKIRQTGALERSLRKELILNGGDVRAVFVKFHMYGRFRDMGVGRGLKSYERGSNKMLKSGAKVGAKVGFVNREPARWFNKIKTAQIWKLRELLIQDMDHASVRNIKNEVEKITQYEINV